MPEFYNPYQFIPVKSKKDQSPGMLAIDKIIDGEQYARHDLWQADYFSGKISCTLTVQTPMVTGNEHRDQEHISVVKSYEYQNQTAIAANTLRGMLSSVCETISCSAMRVLDDKKYSFRKDVGEGLPATGQILYEEGQWYILPLTISGLEKNKQNKFWRCDPKWQQIFQDNYGKTTHWEDILPIYIPNGHTEFDLPHEIYERHCSNPIYFIPASASKTPLDDKFLPKKTSDIKSKGSFLIGREIDANKVFTKQNSNKDYIPVILRQLEKKGFEDDIPKTKKHALLLPHNNSRIKLKVPNEVVERFERLCQEQFIKTKKKLEKSGSTKEPFPMQLRGYRNRRKTQHRDKDIWELMSGEIVYFNINNNGQVTEISTSAIWRSETADSSYDYFNRIGKNITPLNNKNRSHLTPAEILFGLTETKDETKAENETSSFALASRIRFSDAILDTENPNQPQSIFGEAVVLQRMGEPKPPSPALYFHKNNSPTAFISGKELADHEQKKIIPNGRKVFLRQKTANAYQPQTGDIEENKGCLKCTPVQPKTQFQFSIYYENICKQELGLLLYSLNPAEYSNGNKPFYHLLGLGKPLGMGRVSIDIDRVEAIDRVNRYKELNLSNLTNRYEQLADIDKLFCRDWIDKQLMEQMLLVGTSLMENHQVSYPKSEPLEKDNGFEWFVNNNHSNQANKMNLGPIKDEIPKLKTNTEVPRFQSNRQYQNRRT